MMIRVLAFSLSFSSTSVAMQVRSKTEDRTQSASPNIVWILADDLHYEPGILAKMPNLYNLKREGIEFANHVTPSPLCGPSRASILTGRLTHNAGYKTNGQLGSVKAFLKLQDDNVGKWLTDAGYYTAFLGKYVNAVLKDLQSIPKGWRYFGGFTEEWDAINGNWLGGAYAYYNTSQWDLSYTENGNYIQKNNRDFPINIWTGVHQADFLATQTLEHAQEGLNMGKPFFIFTNPTMVHHGYCRHPVPEGEHDFDDPWFEQGSGMGEISPCVKKERTQAELDIILADSLLHEHTSAWNKTIVGGHIKYLAQTGCCTAKQEARQDIGRRNRTASLADLDDMLGAIMHGLESMNILNNTYVLFTSDNGYHLGEHGFYFGKERPYDHDIRVPMVVRPPLGKSGVSYLPSTHVDITATIIDLAGARKFAPRTLDGKSFAEALWTKLSVSDWRQYSFSEMFAGKGRTWRNLRHVSDEGVADWSMNFWCNGDIEIFRLEASDFGDADVDQMINRLDAEAGSKSNEWAEQIKRDFFPLLHGMGTCAGAACNSISGATQSVDVKDLTRLLPCVDSRYSMEVGMDAMHGIYQHDESWD